VDVFILRAVLCWQLAEQDSSDAFRGLYISDAEALYLMQRPFGSNWGEESSMPQGEKQSFLEAERQAIQRVKAMEHLSHGARRGLQKM